MNSTLVRKKNQGKTQKGDWGVAPHFHRTQKKTSLMLVKKKDTKKVSASGNVK